MSAETYDLNLVANEITPLPAQRASSITLQSASTGIQFRSDDTGWTPLARGQTFKVPGGDFRNPRVRSTTAQAATIVVNGDFEGGAEFLGDVALESSVMDTLAQKIEQQAPPNTIAHANPVAGVAAGIIIASDVNRRSALIKNPNGGVTVRIGGAGVLIGTGFELVANAAIEIPGTADIYAISTGLAQALEVIIASKV